MANESIQQTPPLPAEPGGDGPCASVISGVDALPCLGIVWGVPDGHGVSTR